MTKMEVPWSGVGARYTEEEISLIADFMRNTTDTFTQGKCLKNFEKDFCEYNGSEHAFAVSSCTAALELSAILSAIGNGDEVIIPSHTFCATAIPFGRTGAKIVWADIDPETWNISAKTIKPKISAKTKAIVVVHLYGLAAEMEEITALAKKHDIILIEDCAQALGAECKGKKVGSWGDFGCFSFHTHKNISTFGEGGMLTVKNPQIAKLVPGLRHNGCRIYPEPREKYWVPAMSDVGIEIKNIWPHNFCIGEAQCMLGSAILKRINSLIELREVRAQRFIKALKDFPELVFQKIPENHTTSRHLLPARYDGKKYNKTNHDFINIMSSEYNVKVIVQYYPLNRYPLFIEFGFDKAKCPNTDFFFDNMVSFPFHSWMPEEQFEYMIETIILTLKKLRE